jgi:hypothetical protein
VSSRGRKSVYTMYPKIFALPRKPSSGCEFFKVEKTGDGSYVARCLILDRYLTIFQVEKCERYWQTCPYRRFGVSKMEG